MKKMTLLFFSLCIISLHLNAETIYLNAVGDCLDRMEYELTKGDKNEDYTVYRLSPQANTKLFLNVGTAAGNVLDSAPGTLLSCAAAQTWDLNTIRRINAGELTVYLVRTTPRGYTSQQVTSGAWMQQEGQKIEYVAADYDFTTDLGYINYGTPLSSSLSKSEVSMDNYAVFDCSSMLSFRSSPNRSNLDQSSFQMIPELGITSLAYGWDANKSKHKMRLKTVNGQPYTATIADICRNKNNNTSVVGNDARATIPSSYSNDTADTRLTNGAGNYVNGRRIAGGDYIPENAIYVGHIGLDGVERPVGAATTDVVESVNTVVPQSYDSNTGVVIISEQKAPAPVAYVAPSAPVVTTIPAATTAKASPLTTPQPEAEVNYVKAEPKQEKVLKVPPKQTPPPVKKQTVAKTPPADVPTEYFTARAIPANPCGATAERGYHLVNKGETLYAISRQYGVSVKQIQTWNGLENATIKPCMAVRVSADGAPNPAVVETAPAPKKEIVPITVEREPAPEMTAKSVENTDMKWLDGEEGHTVKKGETISGLAKRYGYTTERFLYINGLDRNATLRIGQKLRTTDCNCLRASSPYEAESEVMTPRNVPTAMEKADAPIFTQKSVRVPGTSKAIAAQPAKQAAAKQAPVSYDVVTSKKVPDAYDVVSVAPEGSLVHVVGKDDTLFKLAKRYNTTIETILELNGMDEGEVIIPKQRLYVR